MDYTFDQIFNAAFAWTFGVLGGVMLGLIALAFLICAGAYVIKRVF